MTAIDDAKKAAAIAALAEIPDEGVLGLGTGSTTKFFLEALAERVRAGARYLGVPTSEASRAYATALGIPLADDEGPWEIAVTVDGADEVSEALDLVKGGGGAHTREKIVNQASRRNVIVVDASKLSRKLGEKRAIPIEVLPFGHATTMRALEAFGAVTLRPHPTDGQNYLVDVATGPIDDPTALDRALHAIPGVVETGLFVGRVDVVLVAGNGGLRRLVRR